MILALLSLFTAILIGLGRQSAALGKIKINLWFFSHFEKKRWIFAFISAGFGLLSLFLESHSTGLYIVLISALFLILFSFFFDMTIFFPEINKVEKSVGRDLNIDGDTQVMAALVNNVAIAYPFDVVMTRHIINDKLDKVGVLVSFCAICRSGLVFNATIDGEILYFKVAGVWRRNMIIVDHKTESLWQQATGECIYGKLKGRQLELLSGENTTWKVWLDKHPDSLFVTKAMEARKGLMSRETMMKGLEFATTRITPPGYTNLDGLPKRATVFGLRCQGISKAYPKSELKNGVEFTDMFGSKTVLLSYNSHSDYLTAIDVHTRKQLVVEKHWWLGWKEFHPDTIIWKNLDKV